MIQQLTEKDKRTLKLGAIAVAVILCWFMSDKLLFDDWKQVRRELKVERERLSSIAPVKGKGMSAKQAGLFSVVPKLEMPRSVTEQKELFMTKFTDQLKKSGIRPKSLSSLPVAKSKRTAGYAKLHLQCQGKCSFDQVLDLLANLYDNPYFVAVEELQVKCDAKKRSMVDLKLIVSTFVK